MARPIPRRQRDRVGIVGRELAVFPIELPNEYPVQAQIAGEHKSPRGIGLNHVRVGLVVPADGKAAERGAVGRLGPNVP